MVTGVLYKERWLRDSGVVNRFASSKMDWKSLLSKRVLLEG